MAHKIEQTKLKISIVPEVNKNRRIRTRNGLLSQP